MERHTSRRVAVWVEGETKKDVKEQLKRYVSKNANIFCTDGANAYKFIETEGYGTL